MAVVQNSVTRRIVSMDSKNGAEATAASSRTTLHGSYGPSTIGASSGGSSGGESSWWRWTHGKSGSISSSSDNIGGNTPNLHTAALINGVTSGHGSLVETATHGVTAPAAWETMRWQKRNTRPGLLPREDDAASLSASTTSATVFSSSLFSVSSSASLAGNSNRNTPTATHKKKMAVLAARTSGRDTSIKKRLGTPSSSKSLYDADMKQPTRESKSAGAVPMASVPDHGLYSDIKWTAGSTKRKIIKKERKSSQLSILPPRSSHAEQKSSHFRSDDFARRGRNSWLSIDDASKPLTTASLASPTSTVSSSSSASFSTSAYTRADPLVSCARAVLQDCIRQRYLDSSNMRKRTVEGRAKSEALDSFSISPSKSGDCGGLSCGSSSSDDELSQLSSLELSRNGNEMNDRDSECKLTQEEMHRQSMLGDYDISSSPDFEAFSPLFEEKTGLPVEIRYQLPLALGTANETKKDCAICQLRYGIGDHIVTLPCQHFFHACCVDKWLWSHTSCPLCRTEVTLEVDMERSMKHQFNECSRSDQEAIRRKMRSSSHGAGFRPVVPAKVEVDELERQMTNMSMTEDEGAESSQGKYLVCPTPQRPQPR